MASQSSAHNSLVRYRGTRRGRAGYGTIDAAMFPEKYESTPMHMSKTLVHDDQRAALRDITPTTPSFASEAPRRNKESRGFLSLLHEGARVATQPSRNPDYDIQFHDKDPRGAIPEQPWQEFRRAAETRINNFDYVDDGDYSVPESTLGPAKYYKLIRNSQDWLKARFKNFATALENRHVGGVGVFDNISDVFKSEHENTSVMVDGKLNSTFEHPENRARATMFISNWVHGGSPQLRANTTSDHRVRVAKYGRLLRQRGLIDHETQLRLIKDDTKWLESRGVVPTNLIKFMSSQGGTASADAALRRRLRTATGDTERFAGKREAAAEQRPHNDIADILSLVGITQNEVRWLESAQNENRAMADHALAELVRMVSALQDLPEHARREIRSHMISRALMPGRGNARAARVQRVNPVLVDLISQELANARAGKLDDTGAAQRRTSHEQRIKRIVDTPVYTRTLHADPNSQRAVSTQTVRASRQVAPLAQLAPERALSHADALVDQIVEAAHTVRNNKQRDRATDENYTDYAASTVDNDFGENLSFSRHGGNMGTRRTAHGIDEFRAGAAGLAQTGDITTPARRNPVFNL